MDQQSDSPSVSWPLNRPPAVTHVFGTAKPTPSNRSATGTPGNDSSSISLRAFLLGVALGVSGITTLALLWNESRLWRTTFFISALSLFHFLEFYMTAAFNPRFADVSAFLLSKNGTAYNIAHTVAMLECLVTSTLLVEWQIFQQSWLICLGLLAVVVGQATRSTAMAHAGTNFNHTVQIRRAQGHELVTHGVYRYFRHPSYFGFFWWGIGTQLVLGNIVCLLAYIGILWSFFRNRIRKEEEYLVVFFGKDYEEYRSQTRVWIPFIP